MGERAARGGLAYYLFGGTGGGHEAAEHGAGEHGWGGFHVTPLQVGFVVAGLVAGWFLHAVINGALGIFFKGFNAVFDRASAFYGAFVGRMLRIGLILVIVYGGLMFQTYRGFQTTPVGFIPDQDKGYFVVNAQLPDGASLERTEEVMTRVRKIVEETPGVAHTLSIPATASSPRRTSRTWGGCSSFSTRFTSGPPIRN